jgi:hypothetical protein
MTVFGFDMLELNKEARALYLSLSATRSGNNSKLTQGAGGDTGSDTLSVDLNDMSYMVFYIALSIAGLEF